MSSLLSRRQLLRYGAAAGVGLALPRYGLLVPRRAQAATTFNIHYNLSAWPQNTALAVGARRSNGGNAYQVITAGTTANTPGAGPTGTGSNITDGTVHWKFLSAIDFPDLQSWANAMPATQTVNYIVQLWNNGLIQAPNATTQFLSYQATAGSFSTLITCAPGEGLIGNRTAPLAIGQPNGVTFQAAATGTATFPYWFINTANVTISGIQYQDTNTAGNLSFDLAQDGCVLSGCVIDSWSVLYTPANNVWVVNNLLISRADGSVANFHPLKWDTTSTGSVLVGNTCIAPNGNPDFATVLNSVGGTGIARNNIFFGSPTPLLSQNTTGAWVVDHCLTDQNTFNGPSGFPNTDAGGNIFNAVIGNQFVDSSTNFRLKAGSSAINAGVVDAVQQGVDIFGVSRPQGSAPDIGANELASGAGGLLLSGVG